MTDDGCVICEFVSCVPDEGWVYQDDRWVLGVLSGLEVPGWLVLALRRHAVEATGMDDEEAKAFGPLVAYLTEAMRTATKAERIYLLSYGENAAHWHVLLSPRGADIPPEHRHAEFWRHRSEYIDPTAARDVAARVQAALDQMKISQLEMTNPAQ
jgi:diadenosine tetraphosphate (Ap4A) HIT family hydrolase